MELYEPGRRIRAQERAEDASRGSHGINDLAEGWRCAIGVWLIEMRVVEDVKELRSNPKMSALPVRDLKRLGNGEIRVKEPRTGKLVAALVAESGTRDSEVGHKQTGSGWIGSLTGTSPSAAKDLRRDRGTRSNSIVVTV